MLTKRRGWKIQAYTEIRQSSLCLALADLHSTHGILWGNMGPHTSSEKLVTPYEYLDWGADCVKYVSTFDTAKCALLFGPKHEVATVTIPLIPASSD
jgi:hypothetical protein